MPSFQTNELTGYLPVAYGKHVASGIVVQKVTEGVGDNARTTVIVWLGEGPWNKVTGYWGGAIISDQDIHFHNGFLSSSMNTATQFTNPATGLVEWDQGVDPWNVGGQTYSGTAYAIVRLPAGITSDDDFSKLKFVCECLRVADYDEQGRQLDINGNVVGEANEEPKEEWFFYSTNAARCMADALLVRYGRPKTRINWPWWFAYKTVCGEQIPWVGGSVPDRPLFTNITSNFSIGSNASVLKDSGGNNWNCGGITESVFPENTISFFEVDAGAGTWSMGVTQTANLTNSNQYYLGFQGNVTNAGDESGILSINKQGVNTAFSTWVAGDRFRVGTDIIDGSIQLYVSKNGERISIPGGTPPFVSGLHGGIALFHEGADILRSTMSPINSGGVGTERTRPRFECGLAYTTSTDISSIIESILYISCSEVQDADGKLIFIPPTMASAPRPTQFDFNESNIVPDSFKTYRLAREQKPTKLPGRYRDTDTPTLKESTKDALREYLIDLVGHENVAPEVYLGSITSGQAECVLNYYIRRASDLDLYCEFRAFGTSWKVLPGDPVRISKDETNWNNIKFEVIEAIDESSVDGPDIRKFVCQIFNEACYSDTDQTPLNSSVTDLVTNEISAPFAPTGVTATFLLNAVRYKWDTANNPSLIREYEIWSSLDTSNPNNRLWHGLANGWTEPFTAGAPDTITRYIRAVSILGTPSEFSSVNTNTNTVVSPSNYSLTYDNNVLHHNFSPSNPATGIIRYEIATDVNFNNIIFSALATHFEEVVTTVGTPIRYLRAVNTLEKYSPVVTSNITIGTPNPPTSSSFIYDGINIRWNWVASTSSNIAYYEITDSTGTVIKTRTAFTEWTTSQVRGTPSYSFRVYAVNQSGIRSASFLPITATIPAPNPVSGLSVSFDNNSGVIRWSFTPSGSVDTESVVLTAVGGNLPALTVNKNGTSVTEPPTEGVPTIQRVATVISTNGQVSSAVSATFTAPVPVTPTISLNRQYPASADINVVSSIPSRTVKSTVAVVSTSSATNFTSGIIQTLPEPGKQERLTVFGRASQNTNLFVKAQYIDVWGQQSGLSNELTVTFTPFLGSDLSNNSVTSLQLLLNNFDNLAENPGFERGNAGWNSPVNLGIFQNSGWEISGTWALAAPAYSFDARSARNNTRVDCKPGDTFYAEVQFKTFRQSGSGGETTPTGLRFRWLDSANNLLSTSQVSATSINTAGAPQLIGGTFTAPNNAVYAELECFMDATGGSLWGIGFDNVYWRKMITSTIIGIAVIQTAHIAELAVTNGKILNMSAEKLIAAQGDIGLLFAERIISRDYAAVPNADTLLNGDISDSVTTITVDSTSGFPNSGAISVANDDGGREVIYYTGKSSTTFTGCTRGQESSIASFHSDNSVVMARGIGWMMHPQRGTSTPGAIEGNSGFSSQGIPATETTFRAVGAISDKRTWKGNTTGVVPASYISKGFIESAYSDRLESVCHVSIGINIDAFEDAASGYGSIDLCEIVIYNKFSERVHQDERWYRSWGGQGHIGHFQYFRKYADPWDEVAFRVRIHNYHGWSNPIWISEGIRNPSWAGGAAWSADGTSPAFLARQHCPTELIGVPTSPDTVTLSWSPATSNAGTQTLQVRKRTFDNQTWIQWFDAVTGISSSASSYIWNVAEPDTEYEFRVRNTNVTNAYSNIVYCKTGSLSATVSRPAPSAVTGTARNSTTIDWSWTRNATDNTDVEYSLDGGSWTSTGSATTMTLTTDTHTAGTSHSLRVRNKWSTGVANSPEASSLPVSTPASVAASSDPSGLSLSSGFTSISSNWTNNGSVNQTLEYKLSSSGVWTTVSLGAVNSHNISGLQSGKFYDVRVKATSGTNYINSSISTLSFQEDPDPFCVLLDSEITLERGLVDYARSVKSGDVVMTGKYNPAIIEEAVFGKTASYMIIHNEFGDILGCSPSHPLLGNLQETEVVYAKQLWDAVINKRKMKVKMNDCGREYMAEIVAVEWIMTEMPVWIAKMSHSDHTFIANKFVSHNIGRKPLAA